MDYHNQYLTDRNKENIHPNKQQKSIEEYELILKQNEYEICKLRAEIKQNNNLNSKVKTELLQVSKKETEEYANNVEIYAKELQQTYHENESLKNEINQYQEKERDQNEKMQTLSIATEQLNNKNKQKEQELQRLQNQTMSIQHEKQLLQQQLQSLRDNFFNDDNLMRILCEKLDISSCHSFNDLFNFISDSKRIMNENKRYKIELISFKKQIEIYQENKNIEKGELIHVESLRSENENLRKEIGILEEANSKLATDLIERSEKKMSLMTESLNKLQKEHNRIYCDYDKKIDKIRRERKSYQHKYEHFKKEAKDFATKYEELSTKYSELQQQCAIYQRTDDNVSEDYERRMSELEANNDALNEQLQSARHEIEELNLLKDNLTKNKIIHQKEIINLKNDINIKDDELNTIKKEQEAVTNNLNQLKASKVLMETMWNEFKNEYKNNQNQQIIQNKHLTTKLLNDLESKLHENQQHEFHRFHQQIQEYQNEIISLKQQLESNKMNKNTKKHNEEIELLQQENEILNTQISDLKQQINNIDNESNDSSLMLINNNDTLKQRLIGLKNENIKLHQELNQIKRRLDNRGWEETLNQQNLNNEIEILQNTLCHNQSRLKDKLHEIEELKKILNSTELKLQEIRSKHESSMKRNVRMESQIKNLKLFNDTLQGNNNEYKNEIKTLRKTMESWYDKHSINNNNNHSIQDSSKSQFINTLKIQNDELRKNLEILQENILSLKEEISSLQQTNNTLNDRYESSNKIIESRDSQIEQLRETLNITQNRESKLMKQLTENKLNLQKFKIESQQFKQQLIDKKQENEKLSQQIKFFQISIQTNNHQQREQDKFEQFTKLTNKLEIVTKNAETLKLTNNKMHEQIEYLKKEYGDLHDELSKKEHQFIKLQQQFDGKHVLNDKYTVLSKKYEILKQHWDGMNKDRSVAIEQLKSEAQKVSESEHKLSKLRISIAELNHERIKLEKEKESTHELLKNLKLELRNKQIELENVDEEKLKWKARTDRLKVANQKVSNAVIMNEVKVQEEMSSLKLENSNLKQEVEKKLYEIEDLQNKNKQMIQEMNEWKLKYDEINDKYEFESGQHDNTLKKLNDLRSISHGETNLNQLLEIKQQNIQELQSKFNEFEKLKTNYSKLLKENDKLKNENNRTQKIIDEQCNVQSSLKTRINIQRNIINQNNDPNNNNINISSEEYQYIQHQLNILQELQNKYTISQQQVIELENQLSKYNDIKTDLDSSEIITNYNNNNGMNGMQELVAYLHTKEQSLHDLQEEYEQIKTENAALINNIETLEENKITLQNTLKESEKKLKNTEESLIATQTTIHSIEGQRDSLAKKLRTVSAGNAKLRVELYSLSSAADLVQEQLKTSAVALSSTTDKKHKLIQQIENLRENLKYAEQEIINLKNKNKNNNNNNNNDECLELKHRINQMENNMNSIKIEKEELNKQINELQNKYYTLFNEHNNLNQEFETVNHEISDMKLEKQTVFIERDLLDHKVEQLQGDKSNIIQQLNNLRESYFKQSNKFKSDHNELYNKYKQISAEREEFKLQIEQLLNEKQMLKNMINTIQKQLDKNGEIKEKYNQLLIENDELKRKYQGINNELTKDNEYEELQINYHEQENKVIKLNRDLQTLLESYNNISAENEKLHSENQTLYQQLQSEQIDKFLQNSKLTTNVVINKNDEHSKAFNSNSISLQSLIKRGKLLTEQCADLNVENNKLKTNNQELTHQINELQQQISLLNINDNYIDNNNNDNNDDNKAVVLHNDEMDNNDSATLNLSNPQLIQLRHRNEQLMNQVRSLQHDLETDTELIDQLQKENGELRSKVTFLLQHQNEETQPIIAVDAKGEPWQDIIKGLRKQLQEARREIAQLCEESMGKTQHINAVETENVHLLQNIDSLEKEHKELTASLAATPKPEELDNNNNNNNNNNNDDVDNGDNDNKEYEEQITKEYTRNASLCDDMENIMKQMMTEQKTKEELADKFGELQNNLIKTKTQLLEIEVAKNAAIKRTDILDHELSLLKRAKCQLSDHNEQLATEITNLQSIQFEQQQKISSQQQEMSELQTLYQNVQSQLEIKNSLNDQFQNERQEIIQLFAVTDIIPNIQHNQKMVDLGFDDDDNFNNMHNKNHSNSKQHRFEECKMESMEPSMFDLNNITNQESNDKCFETLDLKHEIQCLLDNYQRIMEKNMELQRDMERNEKEYSMQNDFNVKFEEIKSLLIQQQNENGVGDNNPFLSTPNSKKGGNNDDDAITNNGHNGSANYNINNHNQPRVSLSANISPFRHSIGGQRDLNMTNPDLLNTSVQHMEEIMNTHKLMKEEEFEELLNTKKELINELDIIQTKYNTLSREYANQSQKLSLLEQQHKHISNQLENVCNERDSLRLEMNNNKDLIDKLSKDFKSIGQERDHLYQKVRSLQSELETKLEKDEKTFNQKEEEFHRLKQEINQLNDINIKQLNQIDLLQNNVNSTKHGYNSITNDFKTMKSKYEKLNEEYDNLSCQQQKLYYEMNEIKQINQQKSQQIKSLETRLHSTQEQVSKNKMKFENDISEYQSKITELQLLLDSTKFEMVAKQSSDSNKHIEDLNEQLIILKNKYENRLESIKKQYSDKINKMNEAVTKLSAARTKLQKQLIDRDQKIESALKQKSCVDKELIELQQLSKYQQSVQENEIIKVAKKQHEMLVKQIDHLHHQLKQSRIEQQELRQKAQLHYTRRKEEWKKLKQKDEQIQQYKIIQVEVNSFCISINKEINKLKNIINDDDDDDHDDDNKNNQQYSLSNICSFLQSTLISLTSLCTTSQIIIKQFENDNKYKDKLIDLTKENERLKVNELNNRSEIDQYKTKLNSLKKKIEENDKLLENERLNFRKESKNHNIEFQELSDKFKLIEQENNNLRSKIISSNQDIQELEEENNNLREERRRSLEGNTNNEYLSEKINLQRQLRTIREERDIAEKKLKENESSYKQLSLKMHQIELQFESQQQINNNLETEKLKIKQQLQQNTELISTLEAEKTAISKKNNELYDGNINLEEKNRKSQQEIGKFQVKADRLRQQRDYAKSKYKELKAKFNSLEQQFRNLQSRYNKDQNIKTSQTMPF